MTTLTNLKQNGYPKSFAGFTVYYTRVTRLEMKKWCGSCAELHRAEIDGFMLLQPTSDDQTCTSCGCFPCELGTGR